MRGIWLVVAALAGALLLPVAAAQDVKVAASASELKVAPGGSATVTLTVAGSPDHAVSLEMKSQAGAVPGVSVLFEPPHLKVAAGERAKVLATIHVARDASPANVTLILGAHEIGTTSADGKATTRVLLRIVPAPLVDAKPVVAVAEAPPPPPDASPRTAFLVAGGVAAAVGACGGLWAARRRWGALLFFAPLYTRLAKNRMLENPQRARLAELVRKEPGITFGDAQRRLGLGAGALTHHARMLEESGVLFSSPDGQARRLFHVGHGRVAPIAPLAERAVAALREGPSTLGALAEKLGVSRQALHYHVKKLTREGKLSTRFEGAELLLEAPSASPSPSSS